MWTRIICHAEVEVTKSPNLLHLRVPYTGRSHTVADAAPVLLVSVETTLNRVVASRDSRGTATVRTAPHER